MKKNLLNLSKITANTLICIGLITACAPKKPDPEALAREAEKVAQVYSFSDPELSETSGLARSGRYPTQYWAINDSGNAPKLFLVDTHGQITGEVTVTGAKNTDWEDVASFKQNNTPWLLIADSGDNLAMRDEIQLHLLLEPNEKIQSVQIERTIRVQYPDGARDCEAVAVDAAEGFIYLLTKRDTPAHLYRVPLASGDQKAVIAEKLGVVASLEYPFSNESEDFGNFATMPTAMDFSADGNYAVVIGYQRLAYIFKREGNESWHKALNRAPQLVGLPSLPQSEAVAFDFELKRILVGSERTPGLAVVPFTPNP